MNTKPICNNTIVTILRSARVIVRWYILFSVQTALIFIIAKLNQSIMQIVIFNAGIASALGFMLTGVSEITVFMVERQKLSVLITAFFESILYMVLFFLAFFTLKLLKGFNL